MKKIVFLSLFALCLPLAMMAQSNDDDLYFIPSKEKEKEVKASVKRTPEKREVTTTVYTAPGTTVVVKDKKGNTRDVDEYNRRYDSRDNEFALEDDTLVIKEKAQPGLDGEWVNGEFNGSQDDYEYAERIIRFRNPRYAISISSPFYWDVMYGANSWDWNVYSDGLYAYAFPTFTNRLWWDWRFNSFGGGWGFGFGSPYYGWGGYPGYWGGGYWGGGWGHHHHGHYPGYYPGWGGGGNHWASNTTYTDRRWNGSRDTNANRRPSTGVGLQNRRSEAGATSRRTVSGTSRVVGARTPGVTSRTEGTSRSRGTYTRPSSTRNSTGEAVRGSVQSSRTTGSSVSRSTSGATNRTYSRGSSDAPVRTNSTESTRRSYDNSSSSSSRSYSPSSSSRSSGSSYSGGGGSSSSRSSGGGGGSSRGSRR